MRRIIIKINAVLLALFFLQSCYIPRGFQKPVTVKITDGFNVQLKSFVAQPQYLYYKSADEYKASFLSAFRSETGLSKNVTLITDDTSQADYFLKITSFTISESDSKETVNDPKSPYNGSTFFLASCDGRVSFEWYKTSTGEKVASGNASLIKSEKLKNNQNLIQMAVGTNKDNTQYRQKMLSDDVCDDVARRCGNRTWSSASAKLARYVKKGK